MKKYSAEWKKATQKWHQKHADSSIYRHWICNGTEYSKKTSYRTLREAAETGIAS